jgi:hypothetical protein
MTIPQASIIVGIHIAGLVNEQGHIGDEEDKLTAMPVCQYLALPICNV